MSNVLQQRLPLLQHLWSENPARYRCRCNANCGACENPPHCSGKPSSTAFRLRPDPRCCGFAPVSRPDSQLPVSVISISCQYPVRTLATCYRSRLIGRSVEPSSLVAAAKPVPVFRYFPVSDSPDASQTCWPLLLDSRVWIKPTFPRNSGRPTSSCGDPPTSVV